MRSSAATRRASCVTGHEPAGDHRRRGRGRQRSSRPATASPSISASAAASARPAAWAISSSVPTGAASASPRTAATPNISSCPSATACAFPTQCPTSPPPISTDAFGTLYSACKKLARQRRERRSASGGSGRWARAACSPPRRSARASSRSIPIEERRQVRAEPRRRSHARSDRARRARQARRLRRAAGARRRDRLLGTAGGAEHGAGQRAPPRPRRLRRRIPRDHDPAQRPADPQAAHADGLLVFQHLRIRGDRRRPDDANASISSGSRRIASASTRRRRPSACSTSARRKKRSSCSEGASRWRSNIPSTRGAIRAFRSGFPPIRSRRPPSASRAPATTASRSAAPRRTPGPRISRPRGAGS